jgi:putative ABC transport system permease protein
MFKLNLTIALRNLWKNKGYTFINIAGLSIGMAGCILIFIFISHQMSYDQDFNNHARIYRVVTKAEYTNGEKQYTSAVPKPMAPALRNDFGMVEEAASLQGSWGIVKVEDAVGQVKIKTDQRAFYVEPQFFKIFAYTWLAGNPDQSLKAPYTVALSESMATKFFGDWHQALGKTINYQNNADLKVTGVFKDLDGNITNQINIAISYASFNDGNLNNWGVIDSDAECYLLLKDGVDIANLQEPKKWLIKKHYTNNGGVGKPDHIFQPLDDIHHDSRFSNFAGKITTKKEMLGLAIIGVFLMITACINFINLATAQAIGRSKEVGVRKVMGSRRAQLIAQFLTETVTLTVFALLLACVITEFSLPGLASLFKEKLAFGLLDNPVVVIFMLLLVIFVGIVAGVYPALVMSGFSPALAIKNKVSMGNTGGLALRKVLVVIQFAITVILIIGTFVILMQMKYMREKPLGFNSSAVAMISMPDDSVSRLKYDVLKSRLLQQPGVLAVSLANAAPSTYANAYNSFSFEGGAQQDFQVNTKSVDEDYFKAFDLKFVAGRGLAKSDTIKEFVINETLMHRLHITDPEKALGKMVTLGQSTAPIVGVLKDFNNMTLRETISPLLFSTRKFRYYTMAVKMDAHRLPEVMKNTEVLWNSYFSDYVYYSSFVDDDINNYYESERVMGTLFKVFATVIIFIAFIGLFGLISFVATQRTREMAIRKVLGASTTELIKMLNSSFIKLIFLANLIAWPIAYILIKNWLAGYTYRIEISVWPFIAAMSVSMLLTILTVSFRTYNAARTNPVDALKYE